MGLILFLLLLAVPLAELFVIVQVAEGIGTLPALVLLFAMSLAGAWLLKREGLAAWRRVRATAARGEVPAREITDGVMIVLGGALLVTPGFITDVVGLLLIAPPTRPALKRAARAVVSWLTLRRFGLGAEVGRRVYDAKVKSSRSRRLEAAEPPDSEDGSPDKG